MNWIIIGSRCAVACFNQYQIRKLAHGAPCMSIACATGTTLRNSSPLEQNGSHFAEDISKQIFLKKMLWFLWIPFLRVLLTTSCMFQYSLCHGMDIGICDIVHWSAAPHNRTANWTGFSVYVVLVLNVIWYSCHFFLGIILFHHDFHHDSCDYHWDFYGH